MIRKMFNLYCLIRQYGLLKSLSRLTVSIVQPCYLYEIKLSSEYLAIKNMVPLNCILLKQMTLEDINGEIPKDKLDIFKERLLFNDTTDYVYLKDKVIVGHYGLAFNNEPLNTYINKRLTISPGVTYLYDDYTKKEYRGYGYHKDSILARLEVSKRKGYTKSIVLIYKDNATSIASYEKLGFVKKCSVYEVKIFGKRIMLGAK